MSSFGKFLFVGGTAKIHGVGGNFSGASDNQDIWQPAADLLEVEGGYLVQVDIPGVNASSVEAIIDGQLLIIRGVRKTLCPSRSKRYMLMEISRGEFGKVIALPEPVSAESSHAVLRDGVLEIFLSIGPRSIISVTSIRIRCRS